MIVHVALLLLGFGILIKAADYFVDGASSLAKKMNVSEAIIGLTIVAFGTSAPELVVNVMASVQKTTGITFGNVVGSNIVNILLILGLAGIIRPIASAPSMIWKEIPMSLVAALVLLALCNDQFLWGSSINAINQNDGIILLLLFAFFLAYIFRTAKHVPSKEVEKVEVMSKSKTTVLIVFGLLGLIGGGHLVVTYSIHIASALGVSQKVIGLTIVSIGTSLPELVTSVVASYKGKDDIAMGNIVGSNIFNILFILGISTCISPIYFGVGTLGLASADIDMFVLVGATILLFITMFTGKKRVLDRWEAFVFLAAYIGYTGYLFMAK